MSFTNQIFFDIKIGQEKPESIINRNTECPFCDKTSLKDIIAEQDTIILLKNKYPTLKDTFQTVLIETDTCEMEFSTYPKEHLYQLIRFGIKHWMEMIHSNHYKSVLFFKNYGPLSGGSIYHPHMQIIGLDHVDYKQNVKSSHFEGITIINYNGVEWNLSTKPRIGFYEFNILLHDEEQIEQFADFMQTCVHFLLNHFHHHCKSYNFFFYHMDGKIIVKIIPRFVTTPLFIGYSLSQVPMELEEMVKRIQHLYFEQL